LISTFPFHSPLATTPNYLRAKEHRFGKDDIAEFNAERGKEKTPVRLNHPKQSPRGLPNISFPEWLTGQGSAGKFKIDVERGFSNLEGRLAINRVECFRCLCEVNALRRL